MIAQSDLYNGLLAQRALKGIMALKNNALPTSAPIMSPGSGLSCHSVSRVPSLFIARERENKKGKREKQKGGLKKSGTRATACASIFGGSRPHKMSRVLGGLPSLGEGRATAF